MTNSIETTLASALHANKMDVSVETQQKLIDYIYLLERWNSVFNLTAIRDLNEMVWLHLIDSLAIAPYLHGNRIIDVGTGAGLPGIPLALTHPDKHFVLLDSNSKKTRFLVQACAELGIKNIQVEHSRCEDFQPSLGFDTIVSRAFSAIAVMLATTQHFLAKDGQFLAMKGVYPEVEMQAIPADYTVAAVHPLTIKGLAAMRHLVCIQRT